MQLRERLSAVCSQVELGTGDFGQISVGEAQAQPHRPNRHELYARGLKSLLEAQEWTMP